MALYLNISTRHKIQSFLGFEKKFEQNQEIANYLLFTFRSFATRYSAQAISPIVVSTGRSLRPPRNVFTLSAHSASFPPISTIPLPDSCSDTMRLGSPYPVSRAICAKTRATFFAGVRASCDRTIRSPMISRLVGLPAITWARAASLTSTHRRLCTGDSPFIHDRTRESE